MLKITEEEAREMEDCPGCGEKKGKGLVVCWTCFKEGKNPFKWANTSLAEWIESKDHEDEDCHCIMCETCFHCDGKVGDHGCEHC